MRRWTVMFAAFVAWPWGDPGAADRSGTFQVSVEVPVRVALQPLGEPALLTVTADDLERGYKDVAVRYHVSHNDRHGYLLQIAHLGGVARQVRVNGPGGGSVGGGDVLELRGDGLAFEQDIALEFRLMLRDDVSPGTFDWPVRLTVQPL